MKKRILSLILALSMVLSVLPLGAFAADPPELVMGANGLPVYSEGTVGHNWVYMNGTLCLLYGKFDFSSTHPQNTSAGTQTAPPVACPIEIESDAEITGGIFEKAVTNNGGTIYDGTFNTMVENNVVSWGTLGKIVGGAFNATVTNNAGGKISGGAFQSTGSVTNSGTISGGTFQNGCSVENYIYIENGTFYGSVKNYSYIENGTFEGTVTNDVTGYITGGTFQSTCSVTNTGIIKDGIFTIKVENGGIGEIFGGIFAAGLSKKSGNVAGGVFNGKTGLDGVTSPLHHLGCSLLQSQDRGCQRCVCGLGPLRLQRHYRDHHRRHRNLQPERQVHRRWQLQEQLRRQQKHREIHHAGRARGAEPHG